MLELAEKKKGRGTTKKDPAKILSKHVVVKFTQSGYEQLKNHAESNGFNVSTFIRMLSIAHIKANG